MQRTSEESLSLLIDSLRKVVEGSTTAIPESVMIFGTYLQIMTGIYLFSYLVAASFLFYIFYRLLKWNKKILRENGGVRNDQFDFSCFCIIIFSLVLICFFIALMVELPPLILSLIDYRFAIVSYLMTLK